MDPSRKLYRSEDDQMIAGVCGGLASWLGVDSTVVRVLFLAATLVSGAGVLVYVAMWLLVPAQSRIETAGWDAVREGSEEIRRRAGEAAERARGAYDRWRGTTAAEPPKAERK
jgi:phage shock protein PspC (stress-responsive transcriptional regulator)